MEVRDAVREVLKHKFATNIESPVRVGDKRVVYCKNCSFMSMTTVTRLTGTRGFMVKWQSLPKTTCPNTNVEETEEIKDAIKVG